MDVGAFEAKTHFSALLERVLKGERIIIMKHGKPVAMMVPLGKQPEMTRDQAIEQLKSFRHGRTLGDVTIRQLIQEGRRY